MPDYTLTQTAATVDSTLVKSATYIPKAMVTVADITARNAIATADKENGKVVRVLDDGSGNVAYYSWNSGGSTWDNAYFPVEDGTISSASLDTDLYNDIYEPSFSVPQTVTQEITSLPSTVVAGAKLDLTVEGNTVPNILPDDVAGCESTTGFVTSGGASIATDNTSKVDGTNSIKTTLTSNGNVLYNIFSICDANKYYLITAYVKNIDVDTSLLFRTYTDGTGRTIKSTSELKTSTSWKRVGIVLQPSDWGTGSTYLYIQFKATVTGTNYFNFDAIMLQEITSAEYALGESALLSKYAYHRSTKSSDKMRVLSEGKNLFDGVLEFGTLNAGAPQDLADRIRSANYTRVEANTAYTISNDQSATSPVWHWYDVNKIYISTSSTATATSPTNAFYCKFKYNITGSDLSTKVQIEKGSTATTYVPYTETSSIVPVELKSISATIKDEFYANEGKFVKNCSDWTTLNGGETWVKGSDTYTNVYSFYVDGWVTGKNVAVGVSNSTLRYSTGTYYEIAFPSAAPTRIYVAISYAVLDAFSGKSAGTSIASDFDAYITANPINFIYKLATPITTYYPSAVLNAEASGRFIVEPFVWDYDFYDSGCVVTDANYPISSLAYVNIVDKETGAETPVALSTCTVAANGLSFTSTAISTEDFVEFGYNYLYLSTVPTSTYSYDDSTVATIVSLREDTANLDKKVNDLETYNKSRVMTTTLNVGAVSATSTYGTFIAPYDCEIADVKIISDTNVSADNTNYWLIEFIDKGSDGSATNVICTKNTTVATGTSVVAFDAYDLGAVDGTHGKLAKGDVAVIKFTKNASATTMTQCTVVVNYIIGN